MIEEMRAVLLLQCPDTSGIVAEVGAFVADCQRVKGQPVARDELFVRVVVRRDERNLTGQFAKIESHQ